MPGTSYQVHNNMLRGVAVLVDGKWVYLPVEKVPSDPRACFLDALFATKDQWTVLELEPYLDRMQHYSEPTLSHAEMLLNFTKIMQTEERDGVTIKLFVKK